MASSFARFLDHTQRRTTVGKTPLDEWLDRRRDLYLTKHINHDRLHDLGGIRTNNLSRREAEDLRFKPRGHWDRLRITLLLRFVLVRECHENSTYFRSLRTLIVRFFTDWRNYYCYHWHPWQWDIIGGGGEGGGGGSRSRTEGYNRLEMLCATESVMKIGYRAKRSQNFCGSVKDISAAPGGRQIWSRLCRFVDI